MSTKEWKAQNIDKVRASRRKWYHNHKEHAQALINERKQMITAWLVTRKATLICSTPGCGENHPACLDFHHRNPAEKEISLAHVKNSGWSILRIEAEMAKCDVLCANCHRKLHYLEKHGLVG